MNSKILTQVNDVTWDLPATFKKGMLVPGRIIATKHLLEQMDDHVLDQLANVACLPGIINYAFCMPDGHSGYGFPIGGVAAMNMETGVISPGGIGFDINCGMRLCTTNLKTKEVLPKIRELVDSLFKRVPPGVGGGGLFKPTKNQLLEIIQEGSKWCVENGFAEEQDISATEEEGQIKDATPDTVSEKAIKRGLGQLGTLGSGNHYLEIQTVGTNGILEKKTANALGFEKDTVAIMVHCGSRGFGHQIASDYLEVFSSAMKKYNLHVTDRELACAPFSSKEGQEYFGAMACAANFAFVNRQIILHRIRECFSNVFGKSASELGMELVYDVCHNIAKQEFHEVNGKKTELLVHRKGATRAFGPSRIELDKRFRKTGQPIIIGGSMETGSYLLVGRDGSSQTWASSSHGAGRTMSRSEAKQRISGQELQRTMERNGIYVKTASYSGLAEEAGFAYKNVSEVVNTMAAADVSIPVVSLKPLGNVKG